MVQVVKRPQAKKGKGRSGSGRKKPKREDEGKSNATIVVAATSCGTVRTGKKLKRNFVPPGEKTSWPLLPIRTGHRDETPG